MLFLPQPTVDGNRLFSRNTVNGKADRSQCKSQNVTQKPTSHLRQLTSCVSLPPTSIRPSGQKPRHQPRHLPSSLMSHIQPFTMSCLLHVPKQHSHPFPSSPSPPPWPFTVAHPMHTGPCHAPSGNSSTAPRQSASRPQLLSRAHRTPLCPRPLPPLGAHSPGLCLLTSVTFGQPALRAGHQGLRSFLERE